MILFISNTGDSLPIAWRMKREGAEVGIYIHDPGYKHNYDGVFDKVPISRLRSAAAKADTVVFDAVRFNEKQKHDLALLKIFGLKTGSPGVFHSLADLLRKSAKVIGITTWAEGENQREKVMEITGMKGPEGEVVIGHEFAIEGWWNGSEWTVFDHIIEERRLMNYNLGPVVGSQNNTVWIRRNPKGLLVKELEKLGPYLKAADYVGPVNIRAAVSRADGKLHLLEFTPGFKYDALYCLLSLYKGKISQFFESFSGEFHEGYASSARISVPPYPYSLPILLEAFAKDVVLVGALIETARIWWQDVYLNNGDFKCAGADGILGVVAATGNTLGASVGNVYRTINKLKIRGIQYRTDLGRKAEKFLKAMSKMKIEVS